MDSQKMLHKVGVSEVIDRRRFLQRAAVTAASVPVIMTLTSTGASAAPCSATSLRDVGCACTTNAQCTPGVTTCQDPTVAGGGPPGTCQNCKLSGAATTATVCTAGNNATSPDNTCCSGTCTRSGGSRTCV